VDLLRQDSVLHSDANVNECVVQRLRVNNRVKLLYAQVNASNHPVSERDSEVQTRPSLPQEFPESLNNSGRALIHREKACQKRCHCSAA
jgi:hypothetical protein